MRLALEALAGSFQRQVDTKATVALSNRQIVHVDMDAFYASVEQRDDPTLQGKPVVVAWESARSVVCAANYEARKFGIHSAMPLAWARNLCPQAVFLPPDFSRYKAVSQHIHEIFSRYTDLIEPLSLDEAYLDVTSNKPGLPTAVAVAQSIRATIRAETRLTASAGVAPNKFLAKIASDFKKPDGLFVINQEDALKFLAPLSVSRLPGVGKVTHAKLAELGVDTVADLRGRALIDLERYFGRFGKRLHELSLGIDESHVEPDRPVLQVSSEDTFEVDLPLSDLTPHIERLAEHAWGAHQREADGPHGRTAHVVVLKLKTASFQILTRRISLPRTPSSASEVAKIACGLRERVTLPEHTRYRLVGVGLTGFVNRPTPPTPVTHAATSLEPSR